MSRDQQRQRLYDAENFVRGMLDAAEMSDSRTVSLHGSKFVLPIERKFGDLDSVERYCEKILDLRQIREAFPETSRRPIAVRFRKGMRKAHWEFPGVIAVPIPKQGFSWAMREIVILHEIAHHLAIRDQHGADFAGTFLFLIEEIIGPEVAFLLRDSYRLHEVLWTPCKTECQTA